LTRASLVLIGVFVVIGIAVGVSVNRGAAREERVRSTFARLSSRVANVRLFPGYGTEDRQPISLTRCVVESLVFSGDRDSLEVSVSIANTSDTATQPTVEVALFDIDGNMLDSCRPVEFLLCDFEPGERKDMPESFSQLRTEPSFYSIWEPSLPASATTRTTVSDTQLQQWMKDWLAYIDRTFSGKTRNIKAHPHPGWVSITLHVQGYTSAEQLQTLARYTALNFGNRFPGQDAYAHVWQDGHEETYRLDRD